MMLNIVYFFLWLIIWCVLSWPLDAQDIILGVLVSIFVTSMTADLAAQLDDKTNAKKYGFIGNAKRAGWLLVYTGVFLWECLKANIDVARRVLHPDMPIRPGTVKVKISLKSDVGLTLLANSVTLTPGTTSIDIDRQNGYLYVHWIYVKEGYGAGGLKLPVVEKFESILKRIFE